LTRFIEIATAHCLQNSLIPKLKQFTPKFFAKVNPALFPAFRSRELAARKVVPGNDEAVRVVLAFPELNVSPLEGKEFA